MDKSIFKTIEDTFLKKRPEVKVGDNVKLYLKIKEGNKERIQVFQGVVIGIKGSGINTNLMVRKISYGVGVEKIVPLHSPILDKIEVVKRGSVKKAKLFFLRDRVGKKALKISNVKDIYLTDEVEVPVEGEDQTVEEVVEEVKEEVVEEKE